MIINKFIGDVFVREVVCQKVEYTTIDHESGYDYDILEVYDESNKLINDYDPKLLRREIDAILKDLF